MRYIRWHFAWSEMIIVAYLAASWATYEMRLQSNNLSIYALGVPFKFAKKKEGCQFIISYDGKIIKIERDDVALEGRFRNMNSLSLFFVYV